jgi:DNA ligase-associated metallophosphoesterase
VATDEPSAVKTSGDGGSLAVEIRGERLLLHPDRALIWPARRMLFIADPHFGKDDIFRRAGIALPRGPVIADLQRLTALIEENACERLVVLGDFVHAATVEGDSFLHAFALWSRAHANVITSVIAGNHDRRERAEKWSSAARWHSAPLLEPPFVFAHEPGMRDDGYVLCGHIHPVLRIAQRRDRLRVPVFWERPGYLVLPSFGTFTGGANIRPDPSDKVYAAGPERVIPLSVRRFR